MKGDFVSRYGNFCRSRELFLRIRESAGDFNRYRCLCVNFLYSGVEFSI